MDSEAAEPKRKRNGKTVDCVVCGVRFYVNPSRLKNKFLTCSIKCKGIKNSELQSKKVQVKCTFCDTIIFYKRSHIKQIAYPTCSRLCMSKVRSVTYNKNNNPRSLNLSEFDRFFWGKAKELNRRNKVRGFAEIVEYKELIEIYNRQNGNCFYSGIKMKFKGKAHSSSDFDILSIDKTDPKLPYTKNNIKMVINCINMLKSNHSIEDINIVFKAIFEMYCKNNKIKYLHPDIVDVQSLEETNRNTGGFGSSGV